MFGQRSYRPQRLARTTAASASARSTASTSSPPVRGHWRGHTSPDPDAEREIAFYIRRMMQANDSIDSRSF